MGLTEYARAAAAFEMSNERCGEHHVTHHNLGTCLFYLGEKERARRCFLRSLEMRADYAEARNWLAKVEAELKGGGEDA